MIPGIIAGGARRSAGPVGPVDPYFSDVTALLHMDGPNGSTTFADSSGYSRILTPAGASITTAEFKFGGASGAILGAAAGRVTSPDAPELRFASSDFTVECFVRHTTTAGFQGYVAKRNTDAEFGEFALYQFSGSVNFLTTNNGFSWSGVTVSGAILTTNTWYHIAGVRNAGTQQLYVNGTLRASTPISTPIISTSRSLVIGATAANGEQSLYGYIDEVRITKGIARYTANFTPPTAAFPDS
jgi:hypothetical protein